MFSFVLVDSNPLIEESTPEEQLCSGSLDFGVFVEAKTQLTAF